MALAQDASTPSAGTATAFTHAVSPSFSPPAGSVIFVFACGGWCTTIPQTLSITDSDGGFTWHQLAMVSGTNASNGGVTAIWWTFVASAPGAMTTTVTSTTGASGGGTLNQPVVFTGAKSDQSGATVATKINAGTSNTAGTLSITTTQTGSWVYGGSDDSSHADSYTLNGSTTGVTTDVNTTDGVTMACWKATSITGTPGAITLGGTWGASSFYTMAAVEVLPSIPLPPFSVIVNKALRRSTVY